MKGLHYLAFILLVIGGLNWGLMGLAGFVSAGSNWNVVNLVLGQWSALENLVYVLVGLSALYVGIGHKKDCRMCNPSGM